jgi:hypothetical protein
MPTSHLGSRCMSKHITQSKSRLFFGSLADKTTRSRHVRFTPNNGRPDDTSNSASWLPCMSTSPN